MERWVHLGTLQHTRRVMLSSITYQVMFAYLHRQPFRLTE